MQVPLNELLYAISRSLDFVERELLGVTSNHGKRVGFISGQICRAMGMSDAEIFDMAGCAMLHDNALTAYMLEAGPGDIARLEKFQKHCVMGEENARVFPWLSDTAGIILHHHENWDGSGFHGLSGDEIPLRAAALRLADNMDLLLRLGDGRRALKEEMREHARSLSGRIYSPRVVETLCDIADDELAEHMRDANIADSLKKHVSSVRVDLTSGQMLKICGLFAGIVDAKSPYTRNHSVGIAEKTSRMADYYGLEEEHKNKLVIAAYLHDLGKLDTPRAILEKPDPLTPEEMAAMREHVALSGELLNGVSGMEDITVWCGNHHEKLNGRGYPHGARAEELCFETRLIACCDVYQSLTEDRPYRDGMNHTESMNILAKMVRNGELDADIVRDIDKVFA